LTKSGWKLTLTHTKKQAYTYVHICKAIFDVDVPDKIKTKKEQLVGERSSYKMVI